MNRQRRTFALPQEYSGVSVCEEAAASAANPAPLRNKLPGLLCRKAPFSVADPLSGILVHAKDMGHPKEGIKAARRGRLVDSQKTSAAVHPLCQLRHKPGILPGVSAAPGAPGPSGIDHHIRVVQTSVFYILEIRKGYLQRQAGQTFVYMNQIVHPRLMIMPGQGPGAQPAPAVQYKDPWLQHIGRTLPVQPSDLAKFSRDLLYAADKIRKLLHIMQIASQTNPVNFFPQQRPPHIDPVASGIQGRISSLLESGRSAKSHRKQIGMQAQLMGLYLHAGAQSGLITGKHTLYHAVKSKLREASVIRLRSNPAVIVEQIGLLSKGMDNLHQLFPKVNDKIVHEVHPVPFFPAARHMGDIALSLIYKIFRRQPVAETFRKLFQRQRTHRKIVGGPVGKQVPVPLAAAPDPGKIVEKRGKAHHRGIGMCPAPLLHPIQEIFLDFGIPRVNLHQMFFLPMVRDVIIHRNFFPNAVCQEAHRIGMPGSQSFHGEDAHFAVIPPFAVRNFLVQGSVINLPVFSGFRPVIYPKLLVKEALHQPEGKLWETRRLRLRRQKGLLERIRMFRRPFVVITDYADRRVNAIAGL